MALDKSQVRHLYTRRAKRYDFTANLYYLIGFREWHIRKRAARALRLRPGDTVVEIGCGTGLNFSLLQNVVGPEGRIIGVDLTTAMLDQARERVEVRGWANVELVDCDAEDYRFPQSVDGVISTFALTLMPGFDGIVKRGVHALAPGGRWAIADFKKPETASGRLTPLFLPLVRPFGVSLDLAERHPWESLRRHAGNCTLEEVYFGFAYVAYASKAAGLAAW